MGVLSERLDTLQVRVCSPNGRLTAELNGRTDVRVTFAPGAYRRYHERTLEGDLAGLAALLLAARTRSYYQALSEAFGTPMHGEPPALSLRDREYEAARKDLTVEGRSRDGRVRIATRGLQSWSVRISDGSLRSLGEEEFGCRLTEAAGALIGQQTAGIRDLKNRIYRRQATQL